VEISNFFPNQFEYSLNAGMLRKEAIVHIEQNGNSLKVDRIAG
jgi:hypothetical protein